MTGQAIELHHGDCLDILRGMPGNSVDSIVTDPPYGLRFMGSRWDYDVPSVAIWAECLRVLKPGGHLLAFAGTRTQHRMAVRIEDAGFEVRDMIAWVYGSGFPKSLDVSKAIDKAVGAEREVIRDVKAGRSGSADETQSGGRNYRHGEDRSITAPATDAARQWQGWGTALKPAMEPITMARKPLVGTVAANVQEHGTGALNIDGCRVPSKPGDKGEWPVTARSDARGSMAGPMSAVVTDQSTGRWPANLIHDGSGEVLALFPQSVSRPAKAVLAGGVSGVDAYDRTVYGGFSGACRIGYADSSVSAARFFYVPKASKSDRGEGNDHPTVKPTGLMAYLCRLVTPPRGVILDPFMGSASTGVAALQAGYRFIGVEQDAHYFDVAVKRLEAIAGEMASV